MSTRRRTVFILGAGASHGVGFESYKNIKPPLLKDFFKTFDEYNYFQNQEIDNFFDFLNSEFGWTKRELENGNPCFKDVVDNIDKKIDELKKKGNSDAIRLKKLRLKRFRDILKKFETNVLHRTTWTMNKMRFLNSPNCPYHESIAKVLESDGFIINLNYDLIMNMALIKVKNWDYQNGYGLFFDYFFKDEWQKISTQKRKVSKNNLCYFKLHGSLNWFNSTGVLVNIKNINNKISPGKAKNRLQNKLHLIDIESFYRNSKVRTDIIGGSFDNNVCYVIKCLIVEPGKSKIDKSLSPLWKEAGKRLKGVSEVIIAGCSFGKGDECFVNLLKEKINWSSLENFVVAEPCDEVKRSIEEKFGRKIDEPLDKPLGNMEELAKYLEKRK